ncbi:MAG: hypothetical protein GKR87_00150 [Kiritimatiellae bacterium]|nr:hypothetical protein [Kiritimatiellia bacterium]
MNKIGVIANCNKPHAVAVLDRLTQKAKSLKMELIAFGTTADLLPFASQVDEKAWPAKADVVMALGGDGTVLRAIRTLKGTPIPVMGVNLGSLGFMTSVTEKDVDDALDVLTKGAFSLSSRTLIECKRTHNIEIISHDYALNDIVIGWGASPRLVTLGLAINNEEVTSYVCDGMIISTPTGSTGHSLSAGGPILLPETHAFLINVICPHTLSTRPLVIPDNSTISIEALALPKNKQLIISMDGQIQKTCEQGDRLLIKKHTQNVQFIHLPGYSYFTLLRQKLHWRGSNV